MRRARPHVALATMRDLPAWEVDDRPLVAALVAAGAAVDEPAWDDEAVDWRRFDGVLIRTTWDYQGRRDAYVAWAERVAAVTRLFNPPGLVRWNTHKSYLRDLEAAGAALTPTVWLDRGGRPDVAALMAGRGWSRGFLKPLVGAAAVGTLRFDADAAGLQAAQAHAEGLLASGDAMLQPYLETVETEGELSAIVVDGVLTHGVRKVPVPGDYRVQDDYGAHDEPYRFDARERADVLAVLAAVRAPDERPLLYARVDFLRGPGGELWLNELEIVEPSLFLRHGPGAAEALAQALLGRLAG